MRETISIKGRQVGNCGSSCNRRDTIEKRARLTLEVGMRVVDISGSSQLMPVFVRV